MRQRRKKSFLLPATLFAFLYAIVWIIFYKTGHPFLMLDIAVTSEGVIPARDVSSDLSSVVRGEIDLGFLFFGTLLVGVVYNRLPLNHEFTFGATILTILGLVTGLALAVNGPLTIVLKVGAVLCALVGVGVGVAEEREPANIKGKLSLGLGLAVGLGLGSGIFMTFGIGLIVMGLVFTAVIIGYLLGLMGSAICTDLQIRRQWWR